MVKNKHKHISKQNKKLIALFVFIIIISCLILMYINATIINYSSDNYSNSTNDYINQTIMEVGNIYNITIFTPKNNRQKIEDFVNDYMDIDKYTQNYKSINLIIIALLFTFLIVDFISYFYKKSLD